MSRIGRLFTNRLGQKLGYFPPTARSTARARISLERSKRNNDQNQQIDHQSKALFKPYWYRFIPSRRKKMTNQHEYSQLVLPAVELAKERQFEECEIQKDTCYNAIKIQNDTKHCSACGIAKDTSIQSGKIFNWPRLRSAPFTTAATYHIL